MYTSNAWEIAKVISGFDRAIVNVLLNKQGDTPIGTQVLENTQSNLRELIPSLNNMGLTSTAAIIESCLGAMTPHTTAEICVQLVSVIGATFSHEIKPRHVFLLNESEAKMYTDGAIHTFNPDSLALFPAAVYDMNSALACFALGQWTASTYHCMGVVEVVFQEVCKRVPVTIELDASNCTWRKMMDAVNTGIRENGNTQSPRKAAHPKTWPNDERFFHDFVTQINAVGKAYRNPTMHFRRINKANEREAQKVLNVTAVLVDSVTKDLPSIPGPCPF